ncbi:DUF3987 domain-containing protein [Novosphingobium tardum]|uniref:DUF3987 domain-containing protein n=1 Tax=Novosphingobium tardum TaxID=1538021 RepID=A0ABV8RL95_9SPHN
MPSELFGPAWQLITNMAEATSTAPDYPAIAYLAACASAVGAKRWVRPYADHDWSEPCILWLGALGDPSSRKSAPLSMAIEPLRAIEDDYAEQHGETIRAWRTVAERAKAEKGKWLASVKEATEAGRQTPPMPVDAVEPDEPQRRRTVVGDSTPEALGTILSGNPMGTLCYRDELAGWFDSFDRYAPGGRSQWLESYGGRPFTVDRKGSPVPLRIPFNGVSLIGSIQPEKLAPFLSSPDDGLLARMIWAWPDKRPQRRPTRPANRASLENIYRRLEALPWGMDANGGNVPITLNLSADAADTYEEWSKANSNVDEDTGSLLKSFIGKMDGAVLRLALVAELSAWAFAGGAEPREVSNASLSAAALWVDDYAKAMAERVYGDAALPVSERNAALLARYIRKNNLTEINKRELKRHPHKMHLKALRDASAMDAAILHLEEAGWLICDGARDGDNPGRPRSDYRVNPAVLGDLS